jgi:hypothetical protein
MLPSPIQNIAHHMIGAPPAHRADPPKPQHGNGQPGNGGAARQKARAVPGTTPGGGKDHAAAPAGAATITCSGVTFGSYAKFGGGSQTVRETVAIDDSQAARTSFAFAGPAGGPSTVAIGVPGDGQPHTVTANAYLVNGNTEVAGFPVIQRLTCGSPCPRGVKASFRWHYSASGSAGGWSGTQPAACPASLTMGPQAMEGDLKVSPGTTLRAGYNFTVPGNHAAFSLTVSAPRVAFAVACASGVTPSANTFTVPMPAHAYPVTSAPPPAPPGQAGAKPGPPSGNGPPGWYPSADQGSPLAYQGSIVVPDLCGGGQLRLDQGGTFTASER